MRYNIQYKQLILDFLDEVVQKPTVLIGNSVGSLACVIAAASGMYVCYHILVAEYVILNF